MVENAKTESSDPILNNYLGEFSNQFELESQLIDKKPEEIYAEKFEAFTAVLALHHTCPSAGRKVKDPLSLTMGGGDEKGLDSVIIVINNLFPVEDISEFDSLVEDFRAQKTGINSVDFIFVQAKTSPYFDRSHIMSTINGIEQFMDSSEDLITSNKNLAEKRKIKDALYKHWREIKNIRSHAYFMTQSPKSLDKVVLKDVEVKIGRMNKPGGVFSDYAKKGGDLKFFPCWRDTIVDMYENYMRYERKVKFDVDESIALPNTGEIKTSFMTYIYFDEFLKIILKDGSGKYIDESVFEENVRSFQGVKKNKVNSKILETLIGGGASKFFVLNNGITMIADTVTTTDRKNKCFTVNNHQIINGCQTSNMLHRYYLHLLNSGISDSELQEKLKEVYIPLKIIEVPDDTLSAEIVESTNSQTSIGSDQLHALGSIARKIQKFFDLFKEESTGKQYMYYERRNNEYAFNPNVNKANIITQDMMVGIYSATYLKLAHKSSRYAGRLKTEDNLQNVFNEKNPAIKYFEAAYAYLCYESERKKSERRKLSEFEANLKWHTLMVYNILFGENYRDDLDAEQKIKRIKKNLSRENLLIANNVVLKFIDDNPSYSNQSIRSLNKKEEFTNALAGYSYRIKNSNRKNKFNDFIEFVYQKDESADRQVSETEKNPEHSSPGSTIYGVLELSSVLENRISKEASHLFNRIFNGTIEWGNLTFRWRNSDQKNSTYKFSMYVSSKSGSTPLRVGQVVYGKRDKDFKINLGLQHKQLMENPEFYNEFINREIDGFICDLTDKRNEKNKTEYGYVVFTEKSSDDLVELINDIVSKTYALKNSMI